MVEPTGVEVSPTEVTLQVGESYQLTATITPENSTQTPIWSSDNDMIATVSDSGLVTGINRGQVVVFVETADGGFTNATVTVTEPLRIEPMRVYDPYGGTGRKVIYARENHYDLTLAGGHPMTNYNDVVWTTSPSDIVVRHVVEGVVQWEETTYEVFEINGTPGTFELTATTHDGLTATTTVTNHEKYADVGDYVPVPVESIVLEEVELPNKFLLEDYGGSFGGVGEVDLHSDVFDGFLPVNADVPDVAITWSVTPNDPNIFIYRGILGFEEYGEDAPFIAPFTGTLTASIPNGISQTINFTIETDGTFRTYHQPSS